MIRVSGRIFKQIDNWSPNSIERLIVEKLMEDSKVHSYRSISELTFELNLRKNIIASAIAMNESEVDFETFKNSRCNPDYWSLTIVGGFRLKSGVNPSEAIEDIFNNSSLYGFECATAMLIIYYRAVLMSLGEDLFNYYFQNLYLYSWHSDRDLRIHVVRTNHLIPGDVVYFKNPDVNPATDWWRGENAVVLGDGTYFGHGLGILTASQIIQALNKRRSPGSETSAFLEDTITRPSFDYLARLSYQSRNPAYKLQNIVVLHNKTSISCRTYSNYLDQIYNYTPFS
ncbi:protein-glutamine gamma-glutamyltransferase [Filobacillus milosensis]|uniref:Protein-glutamine gamma-glutamyltransferase n=1 Tax=Filobacillus milosensis TaxID=94137 RepID=A0A4Y8IHZ9_9BACI|nr:protein-glutamine gamma-glutamyltransferase [Filobacillus milosensis]TFB18547.1 protein-glutamine gamma-glutamyltransferase [Filobacillus milosensis]